MDGQKELKGETVMRTELLLVLVGLWIGSNWTEGAIAAEAKAGNAAYEKSCAGCHGADGKGNPAMMKVLGEKGLNIVGKETTQKSDEQLLKIISEGSGKMPASKLTKEEQKQVLSHIRSLAK
jgi:mono/diheme cytochrome c family protein